MNYCYRSAGKAFDTHRVLLYMPAEMAANLLDLYNLDGVSRV